jgi:heptosyltransferase-2
MWATKRWPLQRFAQLAERLGARGMQIILTGTPSEQPLAQAVLQRVPTALNLTGKLALGELGGVIDACDVFVANDSGPMHIARALGVPTLAFFGSTDARQFDGRGHSLIRSERDCAPCSFHGYPSCPRGHLGCLRDFDVDFAYAQVEALLGKKPVAWVYG